MSVDTQLAIIGAGPAGLAAAKVAGTLGIETVLLDDQKTAGGQIYRGIESASEDLLKVLGPAYQHGRELLSGLDAPSVTRRSEATVWQITDDGTIYWSGPTGSSSIRAARVIIATGALERPMPFPGWTLPGVMMAGGVQIALKTGGLTPDGQFVLAGSGPLLLLLARQVQDAGGRIAALVETTPRRSTFRALRYLPGMIRSPHLVGDGIALLRGIRQRRIPRYPRATGLRAIGTDSIEGIRFDSGGRSHELPCSVLAIHNGVTPNVQLTRQLDLVHDWQPHQRCWNPRVGNCGESSLSWLRVAGDGGGILGAAAAELQGVMAAWSVAGELQKTDVSTADNMIAMTQKKLAPLKSARTFIDCLYSPAPEFLTPDNETIVCRCEEVTAGDIRDYASLGCLGPNQTKSFGRPGMGPCQGRYCGLTVSELIANCRGVATSDVGYYRIRPPIKPITVAELAALHEPAE